MAEIPSDIASSAAQAGFQAREVGKEREARRAEQTHAANRQVKTLDETDATVDTADTNTQVFTDAEGSGSQGRATEEKTSDQPQHTAEPPHGGITTDSDGQTHVDLEA